MLKRTSLGFVAGALAFLIAFNAVWATLQWKGILPASALQPWAINGVPPFGVPRVASLAFWSGLWGALLALVLAGRTGLSYWISWTTVGAIALTAVALLVVPTLKGLPIANLTPERIAIGTLLHASWGLGTAIILSLLGGARRR